VKSFGIGERVFAAGFLNATGGSTPSTSVSTAHHALREHHLGKLAIAIV